MAELLDVLGEAVTVRDRDGTIAFANRAALESMGFNSLEELQSQTSQEIMDQYVVEDEHGKPLSIDDVPSMRLMHGQDATTLLMRNVHRETGELRWLQLKTSPLLDEHGELTAAVTVIEDVTAVKTAEMRMRMLAESGRTLASSLEYEQTLQNVARLAVPILADWCSVELIDEHLRRETSAVAHPNPEKLKLAERLREFDGDRIDPDGALAQVMRTGESMLYEEITDEMIARGASNEEHLQLLLGVGFRSALVVPLQVPAHTIGAMTLVTAESRRRLSQDDVELAEQLGRRAAVAVENARLHTTLRGVAETLQRSLRPGELADVPGWEVAALYRPAGAEQRIEVGGDFYELFPSNGSWFAVIGDVTGKGVAAAALTSLLRYGARFASGQNAHPAGVLHQLDEALRSRSDASLCTVLCAQLIRQEVVLSSAGHPPAMLVGQDGAVTEIPDTGPLLGAFEDSRWPEAQIRVAEGQLLLLYTDGVTETRGARDRFGTDRLKQLVRANARSAPSELLDRLDSELDRFRDGPRRDDIAALALRPRGV